LLTQDEEQDESGGEEDVEEKGLTVEPFVDLDNVDSLIEDRIGIETTILELKSTCYIIHVDNDRQQGQVTMS